jgi:phosphonate transport system substrate-binding protein
MRPPRLLRLTSCQSENSEHIGRALAAYVAPRIGIETEFVDDVPWQERERLLDEGAIHAGWICGLPYVLKADRLRPDVELIAAPVMAGARYGGRAVYFSDIVVRRDSAARTFEDLRGSHWAYNERGSHSGYNIVRYELARRGEGRAFFGKVVESGSHQATLHMIVNGAVDASAIDSTVLETEYRRRPALKRELRVLDSWGPSSAPPWVASRRLPRALRWRLKNIMLDMHREPRGRRMLREGGMMRFAAVSSRFYDPIRRMAQAASSAGL